MSDDNVEMMPKEDIIPSESVENVVKADGEVRKSVSSSKLNDKVVKLKHILEHDEQGCDLKWTIFVSACQSYKASSIVHPFPPEYVKNSSKDISSLIECIEEVPPFCILRDTLDKLLYEESHDNSAPKKRLKKIVDLLHWLLIEQIVTLEEVPKSKCNEILNLVKCEDKVVKPNHIFKVTYSPQSSIETNWTKSIENKKSFFAFHGSRLDHFHSILHFGLQQHFSKVALFGKGIYLASEIGITLMFSPFGTGWSKSSLGSHLSLVALCEIIDDPDKVKCQIKNPDEDRSRALARDSLGGEVPLKYYVVENDSFVKLKYVLVYSRRTPTSSIVRKNENRLISFIRQNLLISFFVAYCLLLVVIGMSSNYTVQRHYKKFINKLYTHLGQIPILNLFFHDDSDLFEETNTFY